MSEVIRSKFVYQVRRYHTLVTEGDHFALKDVDGGPPTGEYTIAAIRVDYVSLDVGWCKSTHTRVWYQAKENGSWVRDVNAIVTPLVSE